MHSWLNMQPAVLDEIVSLDGPGTSCLDLCNLCSNSQPAPLYRCLKCSYSPLYCSGCIVKLHKMLPLHRLEASLLLYYTFIVAHVTYSSRRTGSSTEPPSICSDLFAILGTTVTHASLDPNPTTSPLLMPTVGIKSELDSVAVMRVLHGTNIIDNYSECAGTQHRSAALGWPSPLTSSKRITKLLSKANSTCTTFISPSCKNLTIKGGQR